MPIEISGRPSKEFTGAKTLLSHGYRYHVCCATPGGDVVASAGSDKQVRVLYLKNPPRTLSYSSTNPVFAVGLSRDGRWLAAAGGDTPPKDATAVSTNYDIRLWDL